MCVRETPDGVILEIKVQPRNSRPGIGLVVNGVLRVRVSEAPTDGKANEAVIKVIAAALGVAKSRVIIIKGHTSRQKTVLISGKTTRDMGILLK
ncbi:MAG: DUF167 domain-containing protein [Deltaproteobacteria bacterium]|nr:DUF167 domain-containing protein [Deltaproteobacteria bacterium]